MTTPVLLTADDFLVTWLTSAGAGEELLRLLARLHPMMVHFPIALLLVAGLVELCRVKNRHQPSGTALTCLVFGMLGAIAAAFSGWLNASVEPHSRSYDDLLQQHRWIGVAIAGASCLLFLLVLCSRWFKWDMALRLYRAGLILTMLLVVLGSHLGGSLVHGRDYLTGFLGSSEPVAETEPVEETSEPEAPEPVDPELAAKQEFYVSTIWPLLVDRCIECHGPEEAEGDLRLDDMPAVMALDEAAAVIAPDDVPGSYLFDLITLDDDDPDRMPSEGDPLTAEQVEAFRRWIQDGAVYVHPVPARGG